MLLSTSVASAHCPEGGQCFSEQDARDCVAAQKKWERCKSELVKCDDLDAELSKVKGQLQECRKRQKKQARTIRHLDRQVASKHSTGTVIKWTIGGVTVGVGLGGLLYWTASR
jgi:hypothetical protein